MVTPKPRFLFVELNKECNLKCSHCHYWKLTNEPEATRKSVSWQVDLLQWFRHMGGETVVTCGGEPLLEMDNWLRLCQTARNLGMEFLSVTNGTRINRHNVGQILAVVPSAISVSLDHWRESEHDRLRGVTGSFRAATNAVRLLVRESVVTRVNVMTILSQHTIDELAAFYNFALTDLGADKLKLNLFQPTFRNTEADDEAFRGMVIKDVDAAISKIEWCDKLFRIRRNPQWLADVRMYLESMRERVNPLRGWSRGNQTKEAICNSYERNIMVDSRGMASACFNPLWPATQLGGPEDLVKYWEDSQLMRGCMVGCKQLCGISHSVRRSESTLKG